MASATETMSPRMMKFEMNLTRRPRSYVKILRAMNLRTIRGNGSTKKATITNSAISSINTPIHTTEAILMRKKKKGVGDTWERNKNGIYAENK